MNARCWQVHVRRRRRRERAVAAADAAMPPGRPAGRPAQLLQLTGACVATPTPRIASPAISKLVRAASAN